MGLVVKKNHPPKVGLLSIDQSINQSIYLYSASSRYLLRDAPEAGLIKKESLEVLVKRSRGDIRGGSEVRRKIIPKGRVRN